MIKITKELIDEINEERPDDQGIFKEPYGIPCHVKKLVVYARYETGGMTGGSCWGDCPKPYVEDLPENRMEILDILLSKIMPNIKYLQYKKINNLIKTNKDTKYEYYGNSTNYLIEYIILDELIELLNSFENGN